MDEKDRARLYRARAGELRRIAEHFRDPDARRELLAIAGNWEAMAERLDHRPPMSALPAAIGEPAPKTEE
jgi:hypothetical protein